MWLCSAGIPQEQALHPAQAEWKQRNSWPGEIIIPDFCSAQGQSKQTSRRKMQDTPLQKAIFSTCCSHPRAEHRVTKAKPRPGRDSNSGKGILALWTQSGLQTQPSSTQGQCFESSASKKVLYTCYFPLWKQNDHPGWEWLSFHLESNLTDLFALPFLQDKGTCGLWHQAAFKSFPPLQMN